LQYQHCNVFFVPFSFGFALGQLFHTMSTYYSMSATPKQFSPTVQPRAHP
jgi:hypothetical protein